MFYLAVLFAKSYVDHYVYSVKNPTKHEMQLLKNYDIWSTTKSKVVVLAQKEEFEQLGIKDYAIVKTNVAQDIQMESLRLKANRNVPRFKKPLHMVNHDHIERFFKDYRTYNEYFFWYATLAQMYPDIITYIPSIGTSLEGRDIFAIKITAPSNSTAPPKKQFFLQSLIHAREWISGTTVSYIVWDIVKNYAMGNTRYINMLNMAEFVIIPIANPDGYVYSHDVDRLWRKNTRDILGTVYGVDLNRNFQDGYWGLKNGSSPNPSDEDYRGTAPYSEPESKAIKRFYYGLCCVKGVIDYHAYGQTILRPVGFSFDDCPQEAIFVNVTTEMAYAMKMATNATYITQKSAELYITTGAASDYFYVAKPEEEWVFALTIELRGPIEEEEEQVDPTIGVLGQQSDDDDTAEDNLDEAFLNDNVKPDESGGFIVDPSEIISTGKENVAALLVMVDYKLKSKS